MRIAVGNDHAGTQMKWEVIKYLEELGHEVVNVGTDTMDRCDYPVFGEKVGRLVADRKADCGILICGTGVGISIAANKVRGIRAAVCSEPTTAYLVKRHNNANIIAFGARIIGLETARNIVKTYLETEFEGGRHQRRIDLLMGIEDEDRVSGVTDETADK